jgi:predicted lipoprotein with Yx(FWY)xxD motif
MMRTRRRFLATAATTATLAGLAGCSSTSGTATDGTATTDGEPTSRTTTTGSAPTVTVTATDDYGDILTDSAGMTLYLFTQDSDGESTCTDGCAENWPPLTVSGEPTASDAVTASLGTFEREDGTTQVTVGEWPLYYYAGDENAGDVNGQDVGGVWYVVAPDGTAIEATETTTTASTGGGGY